MANSSKGGTSPRITKKNIEKEVLTRGKLIPIIDDLKDFIRSTSRGVENVLRQEMNGMKSEISGIKSEMKGMEFRLSEKIDKIGKRVDDHETRITTLETARL